MNKILLLPYAGGSAMIIANKLRKYLDRSIEIVPIELPGRGRRFAEDLITDFSQLIEEVLIQVEKNICDEDDYALLGYSMGSTVVYELYYEMKRRNWKLPEMVFFCAANPPEKSFRIRNLDDEAIRNEMIDLGGTEEEVLNNPEIMELIVPIMRADFQVLNSYIYKEHEEKIHCPIIIQCGYDDKVIENVRLWSNYTDETCDYKFYPDGHFFINNYAKEMADYISSYQRMKLEV